MRPITYGVRTYIVVLNVTGIWHVGGWSAANAHWRSVRPIVSVTQCTLWNHRCAVARFSFASAIACPLPLVVARPNPIASCTPHDQCGQHQPHGLRRHQPRCAPGHRGCGIAGHWPARSLEPSQLPA